MSKFGYQPKPLLPPDHEEFLEYQRNLNGIIRDHLHSPANQVKRPELEKSNKKSTNSNKNGKSRNRNGSVKSDVSKQRRRDTTPSRK